MSYRITSIRSRHTSLVLGVVGLILASPAIWAEAPSCIFEQLIRDMADPVDLARVPTDQEYTYGQASSVDPDGRLGPMSGIDHYVSKDDKDRAVLADLKGPGCVRRMYFAGAPQGVAMDILKKPRSLSFYFDGEKKPRLQTTIQTLSKDILEWKKVTPYPHRPARPLVGSGGGGFFCYLPLPYEKSLKIVLDASELKRFSYQIGYHTYAKKPEGMKSFQKAALAKALSNRSVKLVPRVTDSVVTPVTGIRLRKRELAEAPLAPGKTAELPPIAGPGIIRELDIRWTRSDTDTQRGLVLRCYWDGTKHPSIEVPVDDLFGFDHGNKARVALYVVDRLDGKGGLRRGRLWLPMPFRKSARIAIANEAGPVVPVAITVRYKRLRELADDFGYLHTQWTRSMPKPDANGDDDAESPPHTVLSLSEPGRLIGCMLTINKRRSGRDYLYFGETITADGKKFQGTAMDNFFNGFNKYRRRYNAAYHAVPIQRRGNVTQFRFLIPDSIPFSKSFKLAFPNDEGEDISSVAFWYQRRPHAPFAKLQDPKERTRFYRTFKIPGAMEAELAKVQGITKYTRPAPLSMEEIEDGEWSNDQQLFVKSQVSNAKISLQVPVEKPGPHKVVVYMTRGEEYTSTILFVNGKRCKITDKDGKTVDLFEGKADEVMPSGPLSLGVHDLKQGINLVTFQNPQKGKRVRTIIGIDCILVTPQGGAK